MAAMPLARPQFRLSTLLWITLAVACWFGGAEWGWRRNQPAIYRAFIMGDDPDYVAVDILVHADGSKWFRVVSEGEHTGTMEFHDDSGATITVHGPARTSSPR